MGSNNLFFVQGSGSQTEVVTPELTGSILAGVTRDALLVLAYGRTYREVVVVFEEAKRLRLPIVLITDSLEARLARQADVVVPARRGKQERVALHGVTLIVLEAIVLGLAFADSSKAMRSLARLSELRSRILSGS